MKPLIDKSASEKLLSRYLGAPTKAQVTEYSDLCFSASKMVKQPYIVMHKRLEKLFVGKSVDFVLGWLNQWTHEASKHPKPGMIINARMKQYRERITPLGV
jgi:hypothetical protein